MHASRTPDDRFANLPGFGHEANYFDHAQIREVAERTNARAVIVPENTHGAPGVETYFDLMNTWIGELAQGFAGVTVP
ncbi:MAG: hypothetical protein ABJB33_03870 [Gemmatimonadota bacterium]